MQLAELENRFAAIVAALDPPGPFALAVSGGPDSMALLHLSAALARGRGTTPPPLVLTVDHGLRPEAADEARQVASWAAAQGLPHRILRLCGQAPAGNIQAWARRERYQLLAAACRDHGAASLFTGHTADDQWETVTMRDDRNSGAHGLAGMPSQADLAGGAVRLVRPLLTTPKSALLAYLRARGQPHVIDPSNSDPRFTRGRLRQQGSADNSPRPDLAQAQAARMAHEAAACLFLTQEAAFGEESTVRVRRAALAHLPDPILDLVLGAILRRCGGTAYPGTRAERARLAIAIRADGLFPGRTLAGTLIRRVGGSVRQPGGEVLQFSPETPTDRRAASFWLPFGQYKQLLADGRVLQPETKFYPSFAG